MPIGKSQIAIVNGNSSSKSNSSTRGNDTFLSICNGGNNNNNSDNNTNGTAIEEMVANVSNQLRRKENSPLGLPEIVGGVCTPPSPFFVKSAPSAGQSSTGNILFCSFLLQLTRKKCPVQSAPKLNKKDGRKGLLISSFFFFSFISIPHTHTSLSLLILHPSLFTHTHSYSHSHTLPTLTLSPLSLPLSTISTLFTKHITTK